MAPYAIVQTGGRQYRVQPGTVLDVEKLEAEVGARVELPVLLVSDDDQLIVGTPHVEGARVVAEVQDQFRGPKIIIFKYKPKTRYRRKNGHRQSYTRLQVQDILTGEGAESPAAPPVVEEPAAPVEPEAVATPETPEATGAAES